MEFKFLFDKSKNIYYDEYNFVYFNKNYYFYLKYDLMYNLTDLPLSKCIINRNTFSVLQYFHFFYFYRFNFLTYLTNKNKNCYYINSSYVNWSKDISSFANYMTRSLHISRSYYLYSYYWKSQLYMGKWLWVLKHTLWSYFSNIMYQLVDCNDRLKNYRFYFSNLLHIILTNRLNLKKNKRNNIISKIKKKYFKLLFNSLTMYRWRQLKYYYVYHKNTLLNLSLFDSKLLLFFFYRKWFIKQFYMMRYKVFYFFLLFRFSIKSLFFYKFYMSKKPWRRFLLPIFSNINFTRNFLRYRGIFLTIGAFNVLPTLITYSGYKLPYIILKSKKSFWKNITGCFAIYSYNFISKNLASYIYAHLVKLSLFTNYPIKVGWFIAIRSIFQYKIKYNKMSYFFYSAKNLLLQRFFSGYMQITDLTQLYLKKFFKNNIYSLNSGYNIKKYKRPINLVTRQITTLRRIRDSLRLFYFNKPKKSWFMTRFCKELTSRSLSGFKFLYKFELYLVTLLLRARIVYTIIDAEFLINSGFIFINGIVCYDKHYKINKSDRIQVAFSKQLHLWHRECLSNIREDFKLLYPFVFARLKKRTLLYKMRKNLNGIWPLRTIWWKYDIPRYLEVDYTTMTIFVLYLPLSWKDMFPYNFFFYKIYSHKCYNWRFYF